jgi:hypothetical protein
MSFEEALLAGALGLVLFGLLASGLWVALVLMAVAVIAIELFSSAPIGRVMATTIWGASASWRKRSAGGGGAWYSNTLKMLEPGY